MLKQLRLIKKSNAGFIFPYIIFVTMLLLLATTTAIALYQNDHQLTINQLEQTELESLRQMGVAQLFDDKTKGKLDLPFKKTSYTFPNGNVTITYQSHTSLHLYVHIQAQTLNQSNKTWQSLLSLE